MPITTNPSQSNTTTTGTPLFQDWGPQPAVTNITYSTAYPGVISSPAITFKIKDVVGTPIAASYTNFRLKAVQSYFNTGVPFVNPTSYTGDGYPTSLASSVPITTTGITFSFTPIFQNLTTIIPGVYEFRHWFYVQGQLPSGAWEDVSTYMHSLVLTVSNNTLLWNPTSLAFVHAQNSGTTTLEVVMNGPSWILASLNPKIILSSLDVGVTIGTSSHPQGTTYSASGTGEKTIQVTLSDFYDEGEINTYLSGGLLVLNGTVFIGTIPYSIQILNENTFDVTPESLSFYAVKGITEAPSQDLTLFLSEGAATITKSAWIDVIDALVTIDEVSYPVKRVSVINSANLETGTYIGFINFFAVIGGIDSNINISVTYVIDDFIANPYNGKAFTLDPLFYGLSTENLNSYFELITTVKTFKFFTNEEKVTVIPEKFPLFKNQGKFNLGKKIHQIMDRFAAPNEIYQQYKPAEVYFEVNERSSIDDSLIRSALGEVQEYIAGISDDVIPNVSFLDVNYKQKRVTTKSFEMLNMLIPNSPHQLDIYKNNVLHQSIPLLFSGNKIVSKKITFAEFNQGDVIRYEIIDQMNEPIEIAKLEFVVFPENDFSQMVVWENEFLLQSALEFTGAFAVKNEFEMISQSVYENLVDVLKYLETRKKSTFTINTGWVLQSQERTIESLMRAQRAWILFNNEWISVVPISKSVPTYSSETDLYSYNIEFHINRSSDEKAYTY